MMSSLTILDLLLKNKKTDNVFKNKIFEDRSFLSEKIEFNDANIDEIFDIQHNQLSSRVGRWTYERSGWTSYSILQHQLCILEITTCEGSSYFPLPKKTKKSNETIN